MKKKYSLNKKVLTLLKTVKGRQIVFKELQEKYKQAEENGDEIEKIAIWIGQNVYDVTDFHALGFEITNIRMYNGARIVTRYRANGSIESINRIPNLEEMRFDRFKIYTDLFKPQRFNVGMEKELWNEVHG